MRIIIFSSLKRCLPHHKNRCAVGPKQTLPATWMATDFHKHLLSARSLVGREAFYRLSLFGQDAAFSIAAFNGCLHSL